jgi:hypothetical protein
LKPIEAYLAASGLSHLKLARLSFSELKAKLGSGEITNDIYDHLVTLGSITDSELDIVQTTIDKETFNNLVFLDGFPTAKLITDGRKLLQVTQFVKKTYPTEASLKSMFAENPWFDKVVPIYEDFQFERFDPIILAAPTINSEVSYGPLYLKDGCHRSLALGIKVNNEGFQYKDIPAIIVHYNRDKYDILL